MWVSTFTIKTETITRFRRLAEAYTPAMLIGALSAISLVYFIHYLQNGLGLSYNDARSHLDIGRRVVEGLKPGLAQLGSVWLPLPHMLMVPTIWNDFMWHSGLSGSIQSMVSFVATSLCIYLFLRHLGVGLLGRLVGVAVFVANLNVLYLQSIAMGELLLLATMTLGVYSLVRWSQTNNILHLIHSSFWIMLSTLIRYDGWFLFLYAFAIVGFICLRRFGYKVAEGTLVLFATMAGIGIVFWVMWNQLIFKDALYFIYGPFSARAQQKQLEAAGVLATKGNVLFSAQVYMYALMYSTYAFTAVMGFIGAGVLLFTRKIPLEVRLATSALLAPLWFNILALFMGHSVLFIQGLAGGTWFNVRYGLMMAPSIAIFVGYLFERIGRLRLVLVGLLLMVTFFAFINADAVTIDDARVGSSQKNVSEVSGWLATNAVNKEGFILISAASHDAIIFSSGLPMKRFIHEGTGKYWKDATAAPDRWARWLVMRTNDTNDLVFDSVRKSGALGKFRLVAKYPFADVYELKEEYLPQLQTQPVYKNQK